MKDITWENVAEYFPAPASQNPFVGEPYETLQSVGLMLASQILRLAPEGNVKQRSLRLLRESLDAAQSTVAPVAADRHALHLAQTLAPYCPTPLPVVREMLALADLTEDDVVYDIGCGDGRMVIEAARLVGCRGVGLDIDPDMVTMAGQNAAAAGVANLVEFRCEDATQTDYTPATVVMAYLVSSAMLRMRPILTRQLRPGARIVSHGFNMGDWEPKAFLAGETAEGGHNYRLYLWEADGAVREWAGQR